MSAEKLIVAIPVLSCDLAQLEREVKHALQIGVNRFFVEIMVEAMLFITDIDFC